MKRIRYDRGQAGIIIPVRPIPVLLLLLFFACLSGCRPAATPIPAGINPPGAVPPDKITANRPQAVNDAASSHAVPDALSKGMIILTQPPQRIVSLAPSNTEILFALGLEKRIAGVTNADDFPPEAKQKPNVGGYPLSTERVLALNPDMIIAVYGINDVMAYKGRRVSVVAVEPQTLESVYDSIRTLGKATWTEEVASQIVSRMKTQIAAIEQAVAQDKTKPKVLIVHQAGPLFTTNPDSFIAQAVRSAGGDYLVKEHLPRDTITTEQVLLNPPDVIICDASIVPQIKALPGWAQSVPAVRSNRFYTGQSASVLMRPGPRAPQAIEDLARYLHPDVFAGKPRIAAP